MTLVLGKAVNTAFERTIADALVDVATELRLADPAELMMMIRREQAANIADLVNSSTELFYRYGTFRYALAASFELRWNSTPAASFEMEFNNALVCAFFSLVIGERRAAVNVRHVFFEETGLSLPLRKRRLEAAIADARVGLVPPTRPSSGSSAA